MFNDIYSSILRELVDFHPYLAASEYYDAKGSNEKIIGAVYKVNPTSSLGLKFGLELTASKLCDLSRLMVTAKDVSNCLQLIPQVAHIQKAPFYPFVTQQEGIVSISVTFPYDKTLSQQHRRFYVESLFVYIKHFCQDFFEQPYTPSSISLDYDAPPYAQEYHQAFDCHVSFNCPLSVMRFKVNNPHNPLITSHTLLHNIYLKRAMETAQKDNGVEHTKFQITNTLMQHHPQSLNSQSHADQFDISVRALQKRLHKTGTSYSDLLALARMELTKIYLYQHKVDTEQSAQQLGFKTVAGFKQFFKATFSMPLDEAQINHGPLIWE